MGIPVIDMHCDTIQAIHDKRLGGEPISLRKNDLHVDLERMQKSSYMCQNLALFTFLGAWKDGERAYADAGILEKFPTPFDYALSLSDTFDKEVAANADLIRPALSGSEIEKNFAQGYMSALKTIEEGGVYMGSVDKLKLFYDKGVRMTTLTWNYENELAYPNRVNLQNGNFEPDTENGLKPAGKEMVEACRELGIILDVSHLNDAGIYDIMDILGSKTPFVASHSNAAPSPLMPET